MPTLMKTQPQKAPRRKGGVVVPQAPRWYQRAGAWAVFALVRGLSASLRYNWEDALKYIDGPERGPALYCVWHNRLGLCMKAYDFISKRRDTPGMAAMVSASKDGGFL